MHPPELPLSVLPTKAVTDIKADIAIPKAIPFIFIIDFLLRKFLCYLLDDVGNFNSYIILLHGRSIFFGAFTPKIKTILGTGTVVRLVSLVDQVCEPSFFFQLNCIQIKTQKSLKALFLNFQTFLQGTHIEPVGTHCKPPSLDMPPVK